MSFILLGILNSQVSGAAGGSYELIETQTLSSTTLTLYFNSIPQDFKHLQLRCVVQGQSEALNIRLNSTSSGTDSSHYLVGNGSSVSSGATTNDYGSNLIGSNTPFTTTNIYAASVIDILDYASTTKSKTIRSLAGFTGSSNTISLSSARNATTSAITSLQINGRSGSMYAGSRFSLYGLR